MAQKSENRRAQLLMLYVLEIHQASMDVIGLSRLLMQSSDDLHEVMPWLYAEAQCFVCWLVGAHFSRLCYSAHNKLGRTTRRRRAEKDEVC